MKIVIGQVILKSKDLKNRNVTHTLVLPFVLCPSFLPIFLSFDIQFPRKKDNFEFVDGNSVKFLVL